jgi:hypothetical protein
MSKDNYYEEKKLHVSKDGSKSFYMLNGFAVVGDDSLVAFFAAKETADWFVSILNIYSNGHRSAPAHSARISWKDDLEVR